MKTIKGITITLLGAIALTFVLPKVGPVLDFVFGGIFSGLAMLYGYLPFIALGLLGATAGYMTWASFSKRDEYYFWNDPLPELQLRRLSSQLVLSLLVAVPGSYLSLKNATNMSSSEWTFCFIVCFGNIIATAVNITLLVSQLLERRARQLRAT